MYPVLFSVKGYPLQSFGVMMALAVLCGSYISFRRAGRIYGEKVWDFCLFAVLAGLIGARVWEVAFTWEAYRQNFWSIFAFWQGGLSVQGGILGGIIAGYIWTRREKITFWKFADLVVPGLLVGQALGRVGCYLAGDDYGIPTTSWIGSIYAKGSPAFAEYGATKLIPAELLEGIWDLLCIAMILILEKLIPKRFEGFSFTLYLGLYSAGRLVLENFRAYGLTIWGWRTAQLTSIIGIVIALMLCVSLILQQKVKQKEQIERP